MGAKQSVDFRSNDYVLGGRGLHVHLDGGKSVLTKSVHRGSRFEVTLKFDDSPNRFQKYFASPTFDQDIRDSIALRDPICPREYSVDVSKNVIDKCRWDRTKMKAVLKGHIVSFEMQVSSDGPYAWPEVAAYIATCIAWHIKSGNIPVSCNEDCMNVKGISFRWTPTE